MSKILTIALPTYNRAAKIRKLLDFLYDEISELPYDVKKEIEIYVSDNCSTDNTVQLIKESSLYYDQSIDLVYTKNESNLGLLGNLEKIYKLDRSEYLWLMGDDDVYKTGIVKEVITQCMSYSYSYIFLNHTTFLNGHVLDESVVKNLDWTSPSKTFMWDLYKQSGTVMMFMSACVYKVEYVKKHNELNKIDLVSPCSLSFFCAACGDMKVIKHPYIINDQTNISWRKDIFKVFKILIPKLLLKLPSWGYSTLSCYEEVFKTIWSSKKQYIKYFLGRI